MRRNLTLVMIGWSMCVSIFAQEKIGFSVRGGVSKFSNPQTFNPDARYLEPPSPAFSLSVSSRFPLTDRLFLSGEASANYISKFRYLTLSGTTPSWVRYNYWSLLRLGFTTRFGVEFGNLKLAGGARIATPLYNVAINWVSFNDGQNEETTLDFSSLNIQSVDIGPSILLLYALTERISIEMEVFHGLIPTNHLAPSGYSTLARTITYGLRFSPWTKGAIQPRTTPTSDVSVR